MDSLYLIDASVYVFRAYFSIPPSMVDAAGNPTNAIYGFAGFLCQFLEQSEARHVAVAFDKSLTTSFRNDIFPGYKAQRELPPPELEAQFDACMELTQALGLATYVDNTYEADDLIGTIAGRMRQHPFSMVYVTVDKDLAQLMQDSDLLWDFARDRRLDSGGVRELFGVAPAQIVDLLALVGDKVDNIPGVPGVGQKTAAALLNHFGSIERAYQRLDDIPALKIRGAARIYDALKEHREQAFLSKKLAQIATDAPVECQATDLHWHAIDQSRVDALMDRLDFGRGIRERLRNLERLLT